MTHMHDIADISDSLDEPLPPLYVLQQNRVVLVRLSPANFFNDLHCCDVGQLTGELIRQCPSRRVVIDLAAVQSAGSNFIGMLTGLAKESRSVESELGVTNLNPTLAMTFRIACVNKSVKLFPSLKEATTAPPTLPLPATGLSSAISAQDDLD